MKVKDIMSPKPEFIAPETTLEAAANEMWKDDLGFLPIGTNGKLIGALTDRDITIRAVAQGKDPHTTPVRDVMTEQVYFCYENDDLQKAAKEMCDLQIRRLIVYDNEKNKQLSGILSLGDFARKAHNDDLCAHLLEEISERQAA